jgi:hypothetical protein
MKESAIIQGKRSRTQTNFMSYFPPIPLDRRKPAERNQKKKTNNVDPGSPKRFVQQSTPVKSANQNSKSSNSIQILFKGRKFSQGRKSLLNRREDSPNQSEFENSEEESETCSKSSVESRKKNYKVKSRPKTITRCFSTSSTDEYSEDEVVDSMARDNRNEPPLLVDSTARDERNESPPLVDSMARDERNESPPLVYIENLEDEECFRSEDEQMEDQGIHKTGSGNLPRKEAVVSQPKGKEAESSTPDTPSGSSLNVQPQNIPSGSSQNSQSQTAEETLRLFLSQLSDLSKADNTNCKFLQSNAKQVLSIAEKSLPSSKESHKFPDIKPDVDQMNAISNHTSIASPDASNQECNGESRDLSVGGHVTLNDEAGHDVVVSSDTVETMKREVDSTEGGVVLQHQTEDEDIIIIIDDD